MKKSLGRLNMATAIVYYVDMLLENVGKATNKKYILTRNSLWGYYSTIDLLIERRSYDEC